MKRKVAFLLCIICVCGCLTGCLENKHDGIEIWNKSNWISDDIIIDIKNGYFYNSHKKFTIDDNTIGVTIYFSCTEEDTWDSE